MMRTHETQQEMLDKKGEHTFFICNDRESKGKENFTSFIDIDYFLKWIKDEMKKEEENKKEDEIITPHRYEIIHNKTKEYYDIDLPFKEGNTEEDFRKREKEVINEFEHFRKLFDKDQDKIKKWGIDSSVVDSLFCIKYTPCTFKKKKISFHIIVGGHYFKNNNVLKEFVNDFKNFLIEKKSFLVEKDILDMHYSKNKMLRTLGSSKIKEPNRIMLRYPEQDDVSEKLFYASYISEYDILIEPKTTPLINLVPQPKYNFEKSADLKFKPTPSDTELVKKILDNLEDKRWKSPYDDWIRTVWLMRLYGLTPSEIHDYNKKGGERYNLAAVDTLISSHDKKYSYSLGRNSFLAKWLKEDNEKVYNEIYNQKVERILGGGMTKDDSYTYIQFEDEFCRKVRPIEEVKQDFKKKYHRVLARITDGNTCFLKKVTAYKIRKTKVSDMERIKIRVLVQSRTDQKTKTKTFNIPQFMVMCDIPSFSESVFKPRNHEIEEYEFNRWLDFKCEIQNPKVIDDIAVSKVREFIFDIIANKNQEVFDYLIFYFAHIVQKPWEKTGILLYLYTEKQGCGKTSLANWVSEYLFGYHLVKNADIDKVTQKHNTLMRDQILLILEEAKAKSGYQKRDYHTTSEVLKTLITDKRQAFEPKGVDAYNEVLYTNYWVNSNNKFGIKIVAEDRRIAAIHCNEDYGYLQDTSLRTEENIKFWNEIHSKVLNKENALHFYQHLKNIEIPKGVLRKIPNTDLRKEIISNNKPLHIRFLEDIKSGDYPEESDLCGRELMKLTNGKSCIFEDLEEDQKILIDKALSSTELWNVFKSYCYNKGENEGRQRIFETKIKSCGFLERKRITIKNNGSKNRPYKYKFKGCWA